MSFLNLLKHSLAIIGVFKISVLLRSILFVLVYMFLIFQKLSFIMLLPVVFIIVFLIFTFVISNREDLEQMNNSLSNVLKIDKII